MVVEFQYNSHIRMLKQKLASLFDSDVARVSMVLHGGHDILTLIPF